MIGDSDTDNPLGLRRAAVAEAIPILGYATFLEKAFSEEDS
ncbi:hypothetical protein [Chromatocurvus halotolerans]|nr:hypothetical protein [Chromatocurvus halotolerans]